MKILIGVLLILAVTVPASADLWVATTGNDATGNGTAGNPFLTIQKAVWQANAGAESIVNVAPGTYAGFWNEAVPTNPTNPDLFVANNPTKNVTVRSYAGAVFGYNWRNTVIDRPTAGAEMFTVARGDLNPYSQGTDGGGSDQMSWVSGRSVVEVGASNFILEGFTVKGGYDVSGLAGFRGGDNSTVHGVTIQLTDAEYTVRNSVLTGFTVANHPHGANKGEWDTNSGASGGQHGIIHIENTLSYGNEAGVDGGHNVGELELINSTLAGNSVGLKTTHHGSQGGRDVSATRHQIKNTIIWGNDVAFRQNLGVATLNMTNSLYDPADFEVGCCGGAIVFNEVNGVNADPLFVGGGGADAYQILGGSPAAEAGDSGLLPAWLADGLDDLDLYGNAREVGPVDIGANEGVVIPEPGSLGLLAIAMGACGVFGLSRRRRRS